ncbi:hypothetical protein AC578_5675 [Pseudocercospora eumusae]|uniref:Uncharacterized protein n=1 Tax=Pseudocercospora eumusae TaxID=321146 RepID=A0A139H382_9PEZI|nr:hypothetical protein AC578_5675 [Pseudocercospora eumusae]
MYSSALTDKVRTLETRVDSLQRKERMLERANNGLLLLEARITELRCALDETKVSACRFQASTLGDLGKMQKEVHNATSATARTALQEKDSRIEHLTSSFDAAREATREEHELLRSNLEAADTVGRQKDQRIGALELEIRAKPVVIELALGEKTAIISAWNDENIEIEGAVIVLRQEREDERQRAARSLAVAKQNFDDLLEHQETAIKEKIAIISALNDENVEMKGAVTVLRQEREDERQRAARSLAVAKQNFDDLLDENQTLMREKTERSLELFKNQTTLNESNASLRLLNSRLLRREGVQRRLLGKLIVERRQSRKSLSAQQVLAKASISLRKRVRVVVHQMHQERKALLTQHCIVARELSQRKSELEAISEIIKAVTEKVYLGRAAAG